MKGSVIERYRRALSLWRKAKEWARQGLALI